MKQVLLHCFFTIIRQKFNKVAFLDPSKGVDTPHPSGAVIHCY